MATTNLAGRAGRWSAAHWKTAAFGWIAFGMLIVFVSGAVGGREMEPWAIANGESRRAEQRLSPLRRGTLGSPEGVRTGRLATLTVRRQRPITTVHR